MLQSYTLLGQFILNGNNKLDGESVLLGCYMHLRLLAFSGLSFSRSQEDNFVN